VSVEPIYLIGRSITTDVEGKHVIGRVWRLFELRDAAIAAASRPARGDTPPTPIFIVRAALMIFLPPAPGSTPTP
jgi:hypothetical protein